MSKQTNLFIDKPIDELICNRFYSGSLNSVRIEFCVERVRQGVESRPPLASSIKHAERIHDQTVA